MNKEKKKLWSKQYREKNKERERLYRKAYNLKNRERKRLYYQQNKEKQRDQQKQRYLIKQEDRVAKSILWAKNNVARVNAKNALRRSYKKQRTPKWLTEEHKKQILNFFIVARKLSVSNKIPLEVDHIIPLKGEIVSGLHVPWNLQILSKSKNCSKNNKLIMD